jgi:putative flippase GtrA
MRSIDREFGRFIICGTVNTLVTYIVYLACLLVLPYLVAYTVTYVAGIFLSYYLNSRFTFRQPLSIIRAFQFPLVYIAQYTLGICLLYLLVKVLGISEKLAPIFVILLTLPVTFLLSRLIVRGKRAAP